MEFWSRFFFSASAALVIFTLNGCAPSGQSMADDEKEPHFVLGQSRVNTMDFQGAVAAFEESLEVNPHSAPAHFQLAMLYDEKESNPAAAIYHYQQYLHFDPGASNAEIVTQRINNCKQQLAADVLPLPSSPAAQQQIQQLADTNRRLQDQLVWWQNQCTNALNAQKINPAPNNPQPSPPAPAQIISGQTTANPRPATAKLRTHTVVSGETLAAIARKSGVNLNALLAANPGLNPKKMRVGQTVNLPPP